ncbi:uracil-DNA glycosylase [Sulfurimonas sp.]|uniref:uracil-DNA glycosylase n=1 Tax=Sulfurimonas sp. TaxID=2022749 RepID=UPI00262B7454|nr:uracil-DNA glycosylase [Sulfurimonas sp.]MCW8896005.1 uracil-DNA glycosylase [Sulfurimonas sp.]
MKRINCRICEYYFVTWEKTRPHGCKAYGFKSPQIPSLLVFQSSGSDCTMFKPKSAAK